MVFDRGENTGESWSRRYDRLHLHTIRRFSGLAHFPIPRSYPMYLSRDMYSDYLRTYAQTLGIEVIHGCNVTRVRRVQNGEQPQFGLDTNQGERSADAVVIATGMFGQPTIPAVPGLDNFNGLSLHSSAYKSGAPYAAKRVLVVGIGNTGAEIAPDLIEHGAAFVAISVRSAPPVVPRDAMGVPVQLFGISLSRVPPAVADRIGRTIARFTVGDLSRFGLPAAAWLPFSARRIPVIDAGFIDNLKRGKISIRPTIDRFSENGVVYQDGRAESFEAVIFATGYRTGLDRLLELPGVLDESAFPRSGMGEQTAVPGLYFMGFIESHRGLLFEIELASRRLARSISIGASG
jgi:putative flavoprotein involved in K+ transport